MNRIGLASLAAAVLYAAACSSDDTEGSASSDGGTNVAQTDGAPNGSGGSSGAGPSGPADAAPRPISDGSAPADFWDASDIPAATHVMMFKFLNRTNGQYQDNEVYWRFENDTIHELHSIAEKPVYDMPANSSGRMYFYLCKSTDAECTADPQKSKYYDFIEHTIGTDRYNGNTTRVDAFGLKIAMRLHAKNGWEQAVGEDYPTFAEDRAVTFQSFLDEVPAEYKNCAQKEAPYRIVQPGAAGFDDGAYTHYYDSYVDEMWANNGITVPKPGPNGAGLGSNPDLSAAIYRHVGAEAGTFAPDGTLLNETLWDDPTTFYTAAPADYYARFWHERGIDGRAYGFPYDDVGSYSTYISHEDPQYLLVAIGW